MIIRDVGIAGTMESSDIMVTLEPGAGNGIEIELDSTVEKRFGQEIRRVIRQTLEGLGVNEARVKAVDKSALDCAIRARVKAAAYRSSGEAVFAWEGPKK